MLHILTIDPHRLFLPLRCCKCDRTANAEATLTTITNGFDYLAGRGWFEGVICLPLCRKCAWVRRGLGLLADFASVVGFITLVIGIFYLQFKAASDAFLIPFRILIVPVVVGYVYFAIVKLPRLFDTWTLGIRCRRLNRETRTVDLIISDDKLYSIVASAQQDRQSQTDDAANHANSPRA